MSQSDSKYALIVGCAVFLCLGISTASFGPILPELAGRSQVSLAAMGAVFTAIFCGSLITQLAMGPICDRYGQRPVLLGGLVVIALSLGGFIFQQSQWTIMAFAFVSGLGMGAVVLANNLMIARVFEGRSVAALNLLNFFYGVGAVVGPAAVSFTIAHFKNGLLVIGVDALVFALIIPFAWFIKTQSPAAVSKSESGAAGFQALLAEPLIWMLGGMVLLYVGIETSLGGWIATYMNRSAGLSLENSALVSSGFWLAFTLGRLVNAWLGMRLTPERILSICLGGALTGSLVYALVAGNAIPTIAAILLIGFSFGAIYPTLIAITSTTFRSSPGLAVSIVSSLGSAGGMLIPLGMGYMIELMGSLSSAWAAVLIIGCILVLFLVSRPTIRQATGAALVVPEKV
jgi:fucose permease